MNLRIAARCAAFLLLLVAASCAPTLKPAGPAIGEPVLLDDAYVAADGTRLPLAVWRPEGPAKAVMIGLHGFNNYRMEFREAAPELARRAILLYAYDQRGFGGSPTHGYWAGNDALVEDAVAVGRLVRARHPDLPLRYLGLSMGGAVAMLALTRPDPPPVAGAVLVGPAVWGRKHIGAFGSWVLDRLAHSIPAYPASVSGIPITPTNNSEVLRRMMRDPNVIKETRTDALWGLLGLMDEALESASRLRAPSLFIYGLKDDIVPREPTLDAIERVPADSPVRVAIYPNGHHMILADKATTIVADDVAAWAIDPTGPLPSGTDEAGVAPLRKAVRGD
jgi:alpha-beta hydrolase superfamily lysophospholipase